MWNNTKLTPSASAAVAIAGTYLAAGAAGLSLPSTAERAAALQGTTVDTSGSSSVSAGAEDLRKEFTELIPDTGRFFCVHPYTNPVADRRGEYSYLTPQAAMTALSGTLATKSMDEAICILFHATTLEEFTETLDTFTAVFPVEELELVSRRAGRLATLEKDKLVIPKPEPRPEGVGNVSTRHSTVKQLQKTVGAKLAMLEGYAAETKRPEVKLAELVAKKQAHLQKIEEEWQAVVDLLNSGISIKSAYISGSSADIRRAIAEADHPEAVYKFTAVACWTAPAGELQLLAEVFGL
ncbi:MAG: hypothetical protein ACNI27_11205 [Desulfovibrio sp.]